MAVRLRLRRMGKKKQPFYRIVAIDSRTARDGRYIENLGTYNPLTEPVQIEVKEDRALYWLQQGAIPSDTVKSFLRRKGILLKWHLIKRGMEDTAIDEEFKQWEVLQLERQKRLEALAEQKKREIAKKAVDKDETQTDLKAEEPKEDKGVSESVEAEVKAEEAATAKKATRKSEAKTALKVEEAKEDTESEENIEVEAKVTKGKRTKKASSKAKTTTEVKGKKKEDKGSTEDIQTEAKGEAEKKSEATENS